MKKQQPISVETAIKNLGIAFKELVEAACFAYQKIVKFVKEIIAWRKGADEKRQVYSLDLSRPVIAHQVINRKPKHLVKKIIR